ncbi:hypothetical protein FHQ18_11620 [Deferribacter autotrophicus]|uniref:Uncharacterized protein n=1 Tax=Deferribacter autotrophicus TaxID=500465 RepID=A0A5A8F1H9_9BACT|nr:hypothetical protein [Deferribacter autotrophicus]KAA0257206.1 hypothetical protein FHQ18_11620 [Deferribacter autotrophicus]
MAKDKPIENNVAKDASPENNAPKNNAATGGNGKAKKNLKIFVKQDVSVKINGEKIKFKKGQQSVSKGIADILINAGYADEI